MNKTVHPNYIYHLKIVFLNFILLFTFLLHSCVEKTKDDEDDNILSREQTNASVDFALLSRINETNLKIIEISDLILNQTEVELPNPLILKIKNDHTEIRTQLLKLKEDNLIITPKALYDINLYVEVIKNDTNGKFTLQMLEKTISNEIEDLYKIEETFSKKEFKLFAKQSIDVLKENQEKLSKIELN